MVTPAAPATEVAAGTQPATVAARPRARQRAITPYFLLAPTVLFLAVFFVPGVGASLFRAAASLSAVFGLDLDAIGAGWRAFHFWR